MSEESRSTTLPTPLARSAGAQLLLLLLQFLVGMAVNMVGVPAETTGTARLAADLLLGLHVLAAIGMLVGAVFALRYSRGAGSRLRPMAFRGFGTVVVAFAAGVLTLLTGSDWWSYLMAAAATASLIFYGLLFVRSKEAS